MAGHEWNDWFEREEFIGQISDIRVQNLQVEREVVQKRTFTRWMNLHLEKCNPPLEVCDLFRDIQDGRLLMALLEELSGCKLLHGFKPSSHRIFRLNNIAKVLAFLEERNVKLVSIDAADIADGNSSIILGLIWNIILFFQIKELTGNIRSQFPSTSSISSLPNSSDSDTSLSSTPSDERHPSIATRDHGKPIKTLLQWVQRRTRKYGVAVQDFGKSWTSGLAFLAVIKSIDSTLVDMRRAILRSSRENLEEAFRTAHYSLGIPRLLEPEDVTINSPDEQSIMTYVSQFLEHFPGFEEDEMSNATERYVSSKKVNGVHGKTKKPFVVGSKWVQPPPKIFISSVSEDKDHPCSPLQTPGLEDSSDSVFSPVDEPQKRPQDLGKEVSFTVSSSNSPQPSFVDSVIDSPDSWSDITSEAVPPDKMVESQSDGSLNENELPFDQRDWPPEKPSKREQESPDENGKATEDQVLTDLFIDEGNFSESSTESFQTKPKIPSEEEDAYQYIMGLNEEETAEPSLPGDQDQMTDGSIEKTHVAQNKEEPEGSDVLHKVEAHTTLSQDNITEPSTELSGPETDDFHSKNDDRLEAALECEDTSISQSHDVDQRSSPDFSWEKIVTDAFSKEQEVSAEHKSDPNFKQPLPEICIELEESLPYEFEEKENDEIPVDTMIQNPVEDKEPSGLEKKWTDEAPMLDSTCDPESTMLANNKPTEMIVSALDSSPPDLSILESDDEMNNHWSSGNTSCAPVEDKPRDIDHGGPSDTNETEDMTVDQLVHDSITPEVVETLIDLPPKTPTEEEDQCSPHSLSDPQNSPEEFEGPTDECTDDHAYLSWTARPDSGDDMSDTGEEGDERGCTTGPESSLAGLDDTDSALEFKPAPAEERSLDFEECLAENSEHASREKGRQEGLDASSQMPCLNERLGEDIRDSGGAEPDMPSELYKLIKADEDPVVASENTETLRGKHENEVSTSERHFSEDIDSDGLKIERKKISESGSPYISPDLRRDSPSPLTCGVTKNELYWLLFLWFALYCFFVLPQMDMKTLPYLLLNLEE